MENKRVIGAIIVVLILIVGIIGGTYSFWRYSNEQTKILTDETNKILQSNIITDDIDFNVKTTKNYATVENAIKEYISEFKNIYREVAELNTGINPNNIFSAENMQDQNLDEIYEMISEYKEKKTNIDNNLEKLLLQENITENITKRSISNRKEYFIELYNTIMNSDGMKKQYEVLEENIKDENSKLNEKINNIEKVCEFLKENSNSWTIKENKIQFTNLNRMTEYYNLLNKLVD